jgi:hypothetical protein
MRFSGRAFLTLFLASSTLLAQAPPRPSETAPVERQTGRLPYDTAFVDGDRPGMYVEVQAPGRGWERACSLPCRLPTLGDGYVYRVDGDFLATSREFTLRPGATSVRVEGSSLGSKIGGAILVPLGSVITLVGLVVNAADKSDGGDCGSSCSKSHNTSNAGLVVSGVGVATLVVGIVLLTNGRTTVDISSRGLPVASGVRLTPQGFTF